MARPIITSLLISREVKHHGGGTLFLPFKFQDITISPDPKKEFGTKDKIYAVMGLEKGNYSKAVKGVIEVRDLTNAEKYSKQYPIEIEAHREIQTVSDELDPLEPGYYSLEVRLFGDKSGHVLAEKKEQFTVSFHQHIAAATHLYRATSFGNRFLYFHVLGLQYMRLN
ncbi:MAG: hypothetical protein GY940_33735, partial [bacterium]|nr:hypothetical protein [bacterium]